MKNNWELNLAQGEWFEDNVAQPWLLENWINWWITDCRLEKKSTLGGPRMRKKDQTLVLPDFRLDNSDTGQTVWIDAKYKKQAFSIPGQKTTKFYSIDQRSYSDYKTFMNIWKIAEFFVLIGSGNKNLYLLDLKNINPIWHYFDNNYGKGYTPCFSEKHMILVGTWNPTNMHQQLSNQPVIVI